MFKKKRNEKRKRNNVAKMSSTAGEICGINITFEVLGVHFLHLDFSETTCIFLGFLNYTYFITLPPKKFLFSLLVEKKKKNLKVLHFFKLKLNNKKKR